MLSVLISCSKVPGDYEQLRVENQRLKAEIEKLTHGTEAVGKGNTRDGIVPVELSIKELWSQRFDEMQFRAKKSLDQKTLRIIGNIDTVTDRSVALYGDTVRYGRVDLQVQLAEIYASKVQEGLAALERGVSVSVQGRFVFESMWLEAAVFVDAKTGKELSSQDLMALVEAFKAAPPGDPSRSKGEAGEVKTQGTSMNLPNQTPGL